VLELEMLDVEGNELGSSERGGEPEQQQRPVAQPGEGGGVKLGEDLLERGEVKRCGPTLRCDAVPAADPREDLRDRRPSRHGFGWSCARCAAAIAAARRPTVTGRNPRSASAARNAATAAGARRNGDEASLGAPAGEHEPVALVGAAGGRRERALRVALGACQLAVELRRGAGCSGDRKGSLRTLLVAIICLLASYFDGPATSSFLT